MRRLAHSSWCPVTAIMSFDSYLVVSHVVVTAIMSSLCQLLREIEARGLSPRVCRLLCGSPLLAVINMRLAQQPSAQRPGTGDQAGMVSWSPPVPAGVRGRHPVAGCVVIRAQPAWKDPAMHTGTRRHVRRRERARPARAPHACHLGFGRTPELRCSAQAPTGKVRSTACAGRPPALSRLGAGHRYPAA